MAKDISFAEVTTGMRISPVGRVGDVSKTEDGRITFDILSDVFDETDGYWHVFVAATLTDSRDGSGMLTIKG